MISKCTINTNVAIYIYTFSFNPECLKSIKLFVRVRIGWLASSVSPLLIFCLNCVKPHCLFPFDPTTLSASLLSRRQWIIMAIYSSLLCTRRAIKVKGSGALPDDSWLSGSIRSRLSSNPSICDLITVSSFLIHSNSSILTAEDKKES